MSTKYSITSNEVKLFKHLPSLEKIQKHRPAPILLHLSITNRCNQNCVHCCFKERDKSLELSKREVIESTSWFMALGIKSIEFTGGGEPTSHPDFNEIINVLHRGRRVALGINTNAIQIDHINCWNKFNWIRVAMNFVDNYPDQIEQFKENIRRLQKKSNVTACYIVPQQLGTKNLYKVIEIAKELNLPTRVAPDCIQNHDAIKHTIARINDVLSINKQANGLIFNSDFNVFLYKNDVCMIHHIKPFLYTDGYIYCCPSSELAPENKRTMSPKFRVCHMSEIYQYYTGNFEIFDHQCSYCKYAEQNNILHKILTETSDNEFV